MRGDMAMQIAGTMGSKVKKSIAKKKGKKSNGKKPRPKK